MYVYMYVFQNNLYQYHLCKTSYYLDENYYISNALNNKHASCLSFHFCILFIHYNPFSLETPKRVNSADPDWMPQNVSDQGLHCLLIVQPFFSRNI